MEKKFNSYVRCLSILCISALLILSEDASAAYNLNLTRGVTPISKEIYDLHMIILYICAAIGILVFGVMMYAIIYHRKSRGHKAAQFHESTTVEIIWTIIPFIILVAMAVPATKTLIKMEDTTEADLTIKITGYQWKWHYNYLGEDIKFFSNLASKLDSVYNTLPKGEHYLLEVDKPLVVPIGKKIRLLTTANDVIHSWWVPDLGVKKDAIPGFIRESWTYIEEPGIYRGQCAELCGAMHGFMPIVVHAVTEEEYQKWLDETKQKQAEEYASYGKKWSYDELMEQGKEVYESVCAMCHQNDGKGSPPAFPSLVKSPIIMGDISEHIDLVLHGKKGTAMQAFAEQLSDVDLAAVITYERNAWGNNRGEILQPVEIRNIKEGNK